MNYFKAIYTKLHNFFLLYKRPNISIGNNPAICGSIDVYGKGKIRIGDNVRINSGKWCNPIGGDTRMLLVCNEGAEIIIGNNVAMSNSALVAHSGIHIEDNAMIGGGCKIYDSDFHSIPYDYRMDRPDTHIKTGSVHVGGGVFIGAHSIILKGVTIGEKAVIGAGSVVTKDIPAGEIWAGNPAKFIRKIYSNVSPTVDEIP